MIKRHQDLSPTVFQYTIIHALSLGKDKIPAYFFFRGVVFMGLFFTGSADELPLEIFL